MNPTREAGARLGGATRAATESQREWVRRMADKASRKVHNQPKAPQRSNREKELFSIRAQQVKGLFQTLESLSQAVNKEASTNVITSQRSMSAKNLGGIEVPDAARLVLRFLERRVEVVVNPLQSVGGRPAPIGSLASGSVIQYDASDPTGADWFDVTLLEDGWHRKSPEPTGKQAGLGEKDLHKLIEWLLS